MQEARRVIHGITSLSFPKKLRVRKGSVLCPFSCLWWCNCRDQKRDMERFAASFAPLVEIRKEREMERWRERGRGIHDFSSYASLIVCCVKRYCLFSFLPQLFFVCMVFWQKEIFLPHAVYFISFTTDLCIQSFRSFSRFLSRHPGLLPSSSSLMMMMTKLILLSFFLFLVCSSSPLDESLSRLYLLSVLFFVYPSFLLFLSSSTQA